MAENQWVDKNGKPLDHAARLRVAEFSGGAGLNARREASTRRAPAHKPSAPKRTAPATATAEWVEPERAAWDASLAKVVRELDDEDAREDRARLDRDMARTGFNTRVAAP